MKKLYIINVIFLIVLSSFVSAKITYNHYKINQEDCRLVLESIPNKYYEGINAINFYIIDREVLGQYIWSGSVINSFDNCSLSTLIHELAHHKNKIDKVNKWFSFFHREEFKEAEKEIWQNLN